MRDLSTLLAATQNIAREAIELGFSRDGGPFGEVAKFDALVIDPDLRRFCRQLFVDGHYKSAVEEGFKCLNNFVKNRAGDNTLDGAKLMTTAFSPNAPLLKFNDLKSESGKSEQLGYMQILQGCMTGVRNPRAHEHALAEAPEVAIELLVICNHLMRKARSAKRSRKQRSHSTP